MRKEPTSPLRRFFGSRFFVLIITLLIFVIIFGYVRTYYQDYKVKQEIENLQKEVEELEKKKFESMELLKYVTSDSFVEAKARTELNLKKSGENVIIIPSVDAVQEEKQGNVPSSESGQKISNSLKWWYYFTHKALP